MKSKKGITFGRIILYILFAFVVTLLIWSFVLTYRRIKSPNTTEPKIEFDSSLRYAYNNSSDYSGADYLGLCYLNFYESSNILGYYSGINLSDYGLTWYNTGGSSYAPLSNIITTPRDMGSYDNAIPHTYYPSVTDNIFNLSNNVLNLYNDSTNVGIFNRISDEIDFYNLFTDFATSNNGGFRSAAIVVNCNMPVNIFSFDINGIYNNEVADLGRVSFFIKSGTAYYLCQTNVDGSFTPSMLPGGLSDSIISSIIIPTYVNNGVSNNNGYITGYVGQANYSNLITLLTNGSFSFSIDFDIFTRSDGYNEGYVDGYNDGLNNADRGLIEENAALTSEVNSLNGRINSLESQVTQQSNIINNLNIELQQLQTGQFTFKNFFFSLADVPFKTVHSVLGFEFFGVNLFNFFVGILTALGIIWLIKKIL